MLLVLASVLVAFLIVGDILTGGVLRRTARQWLAPLTAAITRTVSYSGSFLFSSRSTLLEENQSLAAEVARLKERDVLVDFVLKENTTLRNLSGIATSSLSASVISSIRELPYGTFMIGAGRAQGIELRSIVLSEGGFAIGEVTDVMETSATVQFIFAPQSVVDAVSGPVSMQLEGRGALEARALIPIESPLAVGDVVMAPRYGLPVGVVAYLEPEDDGVYSTVFVHVPRNIHTIRLVRIVPPSGL